MPIESFYKYFMFKSRQLTFILIPFLLLSCKADSKYNYAIKDFKKSLQPYLTKIVSKGIVMYYDSSLRHMATNDELIQLSKSEHPVLRASAFREILNRKSFNHFEILMNHLDDTANVATDAGEFGTWYRTVSDDIIEEAKWKDTVDKNRTIDKIITEHNYLRSAYTILPRIKPEEKYYSFIKDMAIRERKSVGDFGNSEIGDFEFALYGLANFKKTEDIKIIKDQLMTNVRGIQNISFRLLKEFPDTSYLEIFETYYKRNFYRNICTERSVDNAINFMESVAIYKSDRSAKILEAILNKKPFINCPADTSWLKNRLVYAIWDNPCKAYLKLRRQIEKDVKESEKNRIIVSSDDQIELPVDTAFEKIRW
jgi:hypothetical protein